MALQKTITLNNGAEGNYIQLAAFRFERNIEPREASATFALFKDAAKAASHPLCPLSPCIARLRLAGAKFDEYLATEVLEMIDSPDALRAQLYAAAKAEPLKPGEGFFAGELDLSDASDV